MTRCRVARWASIVVLLMAGVAVVSVSPGLTRRSAAQAVPASAPLPPPPFASSTGEWWEDAVCYEVFVRSFFDSDGDGIGDLNGLTQKLDYINDGDVTGGTDLGATCVWLMPVMEATSYHGYDVVDYYNVERDYGTNADFERLVAEVHRRGIKVVLDLVLNHTSREHRWFQEALRDPASPYRDWYIFEPEDPGYAGPWGDVAWHRSPVTDEFYYGVFWEGMPDLNYRHPVVTEEARKVTSFWLGLGADGFRLDAIKHLIEEGRVQENTPSTHEWLCNHRAFLDEVAPDAFTVGEIFGGNDATLAPYYPDQLHAYFHFDLACRLLAAAYGGAPLMEVITRADATIPDQRWAAFLTNHDQARAMVALNGDVAMAKVVATALLTLPGLPFVYYGEEIGMTGNKPDERIRTPMQWSADPSGFTTGRPWEPVQDDIGQVNVAAQDTDPASLLNHYRRLIHLHVAHPALAHGAFLPLDASERPVAAFIRRAEAETLLVVLNFGREPITSAALSADATTLPAGTYDLAPLLGDEAAPPLTVGTDGAITAYVPLQTLEPRTGYVFAIVGTE